MVQPEISEYLQNNFSIVKVDVGNFNKNMDISERYGTPTKKGIPAIAVVDGNNRVLRVVRGKELALAHKKGRDEFYRWIRTL